MEGDLICHFGKRQFRCSEAGFTVSGCLWVWKLRAIEHAPGDACDFARTGSRFGFEDASNPFTSEARRDDGGPVVGFAQPFANEH